MKITIKHHGSFKNTELFLNRAKRLRAIPILQRYGIAGVNALSNATPKDTGETASSWDFLFDINSRGYSISWFNTHVNNGAPVAILIQYGHGTGTGGYVQPTDYINPAMKSIFNGFIDAIWKEVSSL